MLFEAYEEVVASTAIYPKDVALAYCILGLTGEAGEIANKMKKVFRDSDGVMSHETREALRAELGDVLWYVARLAAELGTDLSTVAEANMAKLLSRKARGTLKGSGDNR